MRKGNARFARGEPTSCAGARTSKDSKFVDAVARKNVELTMARFQETSPVIRELVTSKAVKIAGAMYDLSSAKVEFQPVRVQLSNRSTRAAPPASAR